MKDTVANNGRYNILYKIVVEVPNDYSWMLYELTNQY